MKQGDSVLQPEGTLDQPAGSGNGRSARALKDVLAFSRRTRSYARRELDRALQMYRMHRVRRRPNELANWLRSARRILIVCHGNIIRSAFAARLITQRVCAENPAAIVSAGLEAVPGDQAHPIAIVVASRFGVDLSGHVAARIAADTVAEADLIFVMEARHLVTMRRRFPSSHSRTFLLSCCAPDVPLEIADPFDGGESVFLACFEQISSAVRPIVRMLNEPCRAVHQRPGSSSQMLTP